MSASRIKVTSVFTVAAIALLIANVNVLGTDTAGTEGVTVVRRVDRASLTPAERDACVTIEFRRSGQGSSVDERRYQLLQKLILDWLNKKSAQTTATAETITNEPSAITLETTTEMPTVELTTAEETTTAATTTTEPPFVEPPPKRRRRRRQSGVSPSLKYTDEHLKSIKPPPTSERGNVTEISFMLNESGDLPIDQQILFDAIEELNKLGLIEKEIGLPVVRVYKGLPPDSPPDVNEVIGTADSFWWLILLIIPIVFIIGVIIYCCRKRRQVGSQPANEKEPADGSKSESRPSTPDIDGPDGLIIRYDDLCKILQFSSDPTISKNSTQL